MTFYSNIRNFYQIRHFFGLLKLDIYNTYIKFKKENMGPVNTELNSRVSLFFKYSGCTEFPSEMGVPNTQYVRNSIDI